MRNGLAKRNLAVVGALILTLAGMITLVAYSATIYRLFCAATGLGGTTRVALADTAAVSKKLVTVRFNTDIAPSLKWKFLPVQKMVTVHLGEEKLVFFSAENLADGPIVGHATYNVTPDKAGQYFNKIQCFCFNEERLEPHQKVEMPVDFFIDPAMAADPNTDEVTTITLSYTFFPSRAPQAALDLARFNADAPADEGQGQVLFAERCSACHSLKSNGVGPALGDVFGRHAGSLPGYQYSPALRDAGVIWTADVLDKWLAYPQALVPGARMPVRVLEPTTRRDIIAFLQRQSAGTATISKATGPGKP